GARRKGLGALEMSELVNVRGSVLDGPNLRSNDFAVVPGKSEPQAPGAPLGLCEASQKLGVAFFWFPAVGIDCLVRGPCIFMKTRQNLDAHLLGFALERGPQGPRAAS